MIQCVGESRGQSLDGSLRIEKGRLFVETSAGNHQLLKAGYGGASLVVIPGLRRWVKLWVQGQPRLHSETSPQNKKQAVAGSWQSACLAYPVPGFEPQHWMKSGIAHTCSSGSRVEVGDSEVHGYPWLQSKFKTSLGYTRPWLLKKSTLKNKKSKQTNKKSKMDK